MKRLVSVLLIIGMLLSITPIGYAASAENGILSNMEVNAEKTELNIGDTLQIQVELFDENGNPFSGTAELEYTSINPYAVSVNSSGLLTANNNGYSMIIVTASYGDKALSRTIYASVSASDAGFSFESTENRKLPTGLTTAAASSNMVYVSDERGYRSRKSALVSDTSTTVMSNLLYASTKSNAKTVDFEVYNQGEDVNFRILNGTDTAANTAFQIRITDAGMSYYNGSAYTTIKSGVTLQRNVWNKVHIEITNTDKTTGEANIYINGTNIGKASKAKGTWGTATDTIDSISFMSGGSGPVTTKLFIDNFSFVDGIVPLEAESGTYIENANLKSEVSRISIGDETNLYVEDLFDNHMTSINSENCTIKFYSESPEVASADQDTGKITAHSEGIAKFIATVEYEGVTITSNIISVEVIDTGKLYSFQVSADKQAINPGEEGKISCISYNILGDEISDGIQYEYTSSDEEIVELEGGGVFKGINPGIATITVKAKKDQITLINRIDVQVNKNSEVTIVQETSPYYAFFPDIINIPASVYGGTAPNGKLLTCYYKNTLHAPSSAADPFGTICIVESSDNGNIWSEPREILSSSKLLGYGIGTASKPVEARDPNFALLNDGTLLLTFWTRVYSTDSNIKTYMMESKDAGETWGAPILIPSSKLNTWCAKRGNIAVFEDDEILVPVYGSGSSYPNQTAVGIRGKRNSEGVWVWSEENVIASSTTTPSVNINEVALIATGGDTVYAFAREPGYVWKSDDRGKTWTLVGEQGLLHQPGMILVDSNRVFCTWARTNFPRPIYGKMFYLNQGWDETEEELIYEYTAGGVDMADPSAVLTNDGRLLTIYYVTGLRTVSATFTELSDWELPDVTGEGEQWKLFESNFESDESNKVYENSYFESTASQNASILVKNKENNNYLSF